jgi:hypothetical protein
MMLKLCLQPGSSRQGSTRHCASCLWSRSERRPALSVQAVEAVNTYNGQELAGRKLLVREDREDRDVKQYNRENGIERPEGARPPRRPRRTEGAPPGPPQQEGRPPKREGGPPERQGESSGLQVRLSTLVGRAALYLSVQHALYARAVRLLSVRHSVALSTRPVLCSGAGCVENISAKSVPEVYLLYLHRADWARRRRGRPDRRPGHLLEGAGGAASRALRRDWRNRERQRGHGPRWPQSRALTLTPTRSRFAQPPGHMLQRVLRALSLAGQLPPGQLPEGGQQQARAASASAPQHGARFCGDLQG